MYVECKYVFRFVINQAALFPMSQHYQITPNRFRKKFGTRDVLRLNTQYMSHITCHCDRHSETCQCLLEQNHCLMQPTIGAVQVDLSNACHITFNFRSRFTQILLFLFSATPLQLSLFLCASCIILLILHMTRLCH